MSLRVAAFLGTSFLYVTSASAQEALPPSALVPEDALVQLRIDDPGELQGWARFGDAETAKNWLLTWVAGLVGVPALDGVDVERPWFVFAVTGDGVPGPWFILPIADRTAFDTSVIGLPANVGVLIEEAHALLGARPFPEGGGEIPRQRTECAVELQVETGSLFAVYGDTLESMVIQAQMHEDRASSEAEGDPYQPPFHWGEVRERVLPHYQTFFGVLEQSELTTLGVDPGPETMELRLDVAFDSETPMGKLVSLQQPVRPSGLEALSDRTFFRIWTNYRLSESVETIEPYVRTLAGTLGYSEEHFEQLFSTDAESLTGIVHRHDRMLTESIYRPVSRTIDDYRRLTRELYSEAPSSDSVAMSRLYESDVARTGGLAVDRVVEYAATEVEDGADASPASETYFAWGEDRLFSSIAVGGDTGEGFGYLTSLVHRSPGGIPKGLGRRLESAREKLVFLSWFDVEAWERARLANVLPPVLDADEPAVVVHATTDGAVVRFGGILDVAQLAALGARESEIEQAANEFFEKGQTLRYGGDGAADPGAARGWYEKASQLGHDEATYMIGYLYEKGLGVEKSYDEALAWYEKAGALGNAKAFNEAGHIFYYGRGREVDYETAFELYRTAALMGSASGQYSLALMFEKGRGVEKNVAAAVEWYALSGEQGYIRAQRRLGRIYEAGIGVDDDWDAAERWYRAAAEAGDVQSMYSLGVLLDRRARAKNARGDHALFVEAAQWLEKAVENGDYGTAAIVLASAYRFGRGVERDRRRAYELYELVADEGSDRDRGVALFWMAQFYRWDEPFGRDVAKAIRLFEASFETGYVRAAAVLARIYYHGEGAIERNAQKAVEWLRESAEEHPDAAVMFGFAYVDGYGVEKDGVKALEWFRKAAEMGSRGGEWAVGTAYELGTGVEPDLSEAAVWYRKSAERGYPDAQLGLGRLYLMGAGVEQDFEKAYFWLSLAANGRRSPKWIERTKKLRDSVAEQLSPEALQRADERVESFSPRR